MKAWVGTLLVGVASASASWAQTPAFNRLAPETPYNPAPFMPDLPVIVTASSRFGAQLPATGIPMPPPPIVFLASPKESTRSTGSEPPTEKLPALADLNGPYAEPFESPPFDPAGIDNGLLAPPANASRPHFWMSADYLFWWTKHAPQPAPLVVTGPATDQFPGALDQPGTQVLYGGKGLGFNPFSGGRMSLGVWTGSDNRFGFELGGFTTEQKSNQFRAAGDVTGNPFLARPFVDALTGAENVYFVSQNFADPTRTALMKGGIDISSNSRLWGYEINGLYNASRGETTAINFIGGFSSIGLREKLQISESLQNLAPGGALTYLGAPVDPSARVLTFDRFDTQNNFYGAQLGSRLHYQWGALALDLTGKAGIGVMQQLVDIQGLTAVDIGMGKLASTTPGGVFAVSSNYGRHYQTRFGVVPEGNVNLSYALTESVIIKAGYTFVYLNSVARPGAQIDRTVNPGLVPSDATYGTPGGPLRPGFEFHTSSFWAQGASFGVEVRY